MFQRSEGETKIILREVSVWLIENRELKNESITSRKRFKQGPDFPGPAKPNLGTGIGNNHSQAENSSSGESRQLRKLGFPGGPVHPLS